MIRVRRVPRPSWTDVVPLVALVVLALTWGRDIAVVWVVVVAVILAGAVLAAVHHAEVVALRVGEPYGSLVLAVSVTVIEVALIVTLMISGGSDTDSLARDTVFAAVMITINGILGLSLLLGSLRYGVTLFNPEGSGAALATVTTLAGLALVLPIFTREPGPKFSPAQLGFAAAASLTLYVLFVSTQTRRHRDFFLPVYSHDAEAPAGAPTETWNAAPPEGGSAPGPGSGDDNGSGPGGHAPPPSRRKARASLALLLVALLAVVGLAKVESPAIEAGVRAAGFPHSFVGVVIALLVLLPETLAAARAALRERIQISLNLAFGSAMASIGLTIPVMSIASVWLEGPLILGLGDTQLVLLVLTFLVSGLTVVPGRATRLQGSIHLVLLAAFLFLAINP